MVPLEVKKDPCPKASDCKLFGSGCDIDTFRSCTFNKNLKVEKTPTTPLNLTTPLVNITK